MSCVLCFVLCLPYEELQAPKLNAKKKNLSLSSTKVHNLSWSPFVVAFPSLHHSLLFVFFLTLNLTFIYLFMLFTWW
jgi:hypothetical protein